MHVQADVSRFNGAALPKQTNATLTLPNLRSDQAGLYSVVAGNGGGSVESRQAKLTVLARPVNDDFAARIALAGTDLLVDSDSRGATRETGEPVQRSNEGPSL